MGNIAVHRYPVPTPEERAAWPEGVQAVSDSWQGWIEPSDPAEQSWIMFIAADGSPVVFLHRDPTSGAVLEPSA